MSNNSTIIGQLLQMISRYEFQNAVSETKSEYHSRGFSSWNHFVSILFAEAAVHEQKSVLVETRHCLVSP